MHRGSAILILVNDYSAVRVQKSIPHKILVQQIAHRCIDISPFSNVCWPTIARVVWIHPHPAPSPSSDCVDMVLGARDTKSTEALPQGIDTSMCVRQNKLAAAAERADSPDDSLGLSAARCCFDEARP